MPDPEITQLQSAIDKLSAQIDQRLDQIDQRLRALESGQPPLVPLDPTQEPVPKQDTGFGLKVINRVGAFTLAIGIAFFFKYAVDNQWVGAGTRVVLGVLAGFALIALAEALRRRHQAVFAQGLGGCGLAALYISIYAASAYYFLIQQATASVLMVTACILAALLSFLYDNPAISALGLAGGFLTPPLLSVGTPHPWILFSYLLLLDFGSLAIALWRRWNVLQALAFFGTAALFLAAISGHHSNHAAGLVFLPVFFGMFFAGPLRALSFSREAMVVALIWSNAIWCLACFWILLDQEHPVWFALSCFALAAAHFVTAVRPPLLSALFGPLYLAAHGCFAVGILRLLDLWAQHHSVPATRLSLISALDSIFLALYALVMIAVAVIRRSSIDRLLGSAVIGLVIAKLYLFDVWRLDRFYRISAFVALGLLLLAASFVYSRFRANHG